MSAAISVSPAARRALFRAILYATLGSMFQVLTVRMLSYVFPFQMIFAISLTAAFSLLFTGIGALLAKRLKDRTPIIMILTGVSFFLSFVLMSLGTLLPRSVMFAVTLENILALLPGGMVASIPLAAAAVAVPLVLSGVLAGGFYLTVLEEEPPLLKWLVAGTAIGFFAGYAGTALLIGATGIWNLILIAAILAMFAFLRPPLFGILALIVVSTVTLTDPDAYLFKKLGREPLTWVQGEQVSYQLGFWSPYSRLDFYDLGDGRLGGLYNGIQWWSTGDTARDITLRRELYRDITGDVLVIGTGGGYGLLSLVNAASITAIELDPGVINALQGPLARYNDGIYNRVETHAQDGRAFLDGTDKKFDIIIYEAPEFVFANSEKSFVSMENHLYTVEGIAAAFDRLKPDGTLIIFHTYGLIPTERFVAAYPDGVQWAVFKAEAEVIRKVHVVFAVASRDGAAIEKWRTLFLRSSAEELSRSREFVAAVRNAVPVTDDRPLLHFRNWRQAAPFIATGVLIALVLTLLIAFKRPRRLPLFFALVGTGFIMTELAIINLLRALLGGYVETTGVALGFLALSTAIGALYHDRIPARWLIPATIVGFAFLFLLLTHLPVASALPLKILWIGVAVSAPGFIMGVFFPAGLAAGAAAESPYFYAVDTAGTALGFILFYLLIIAAGFTGAVGAAFFCYLGAAYLFSRT